MDTSYKLINPDISEEPDIENVREESCATLAHLCQLMNEVDESTKLPKIWSTTKYKLVRKYHKGTFVKENDTPIPCVGIFEKEFYKPFPSFNTYKYVMVIQGVPLKDMNETNQVSETTTYLTSKVLSITEAIKGIFIKESSKLFLVSGHGTGGFFAEVIAVSYKDVSGIAFCSNGTIVPSKFKVTANFKPENFVCIKPSKDPISNINGFISQTPVIKIKMYTNPDLLGFAHLHSLSAMENYFHRSYYIESTNQNIFDLSGDEVLKDTSGQKYYLVDDSLGYLDNDPNYSVSTVNSNLQTKTNLTLFVIDMTSEGIKYDILSDALQGVNKQVAEEFQKEWGANGLCWDMTQKFKPQLKSAYKPPFDLKKAITKDTVKAITAYIVQKNPELSWNESGVIVLVDRIKGQESSGSHYFVSVGSHAVPYAIVSIDATAESWITFSHEVLELLANPLCNRVYHNDAIAVDGWDQQNWYMEVCDPVQDGCEYTKTGFKVLLSDFVTRQYFTRDCLSSDKINYSPKVKFTRDYGTEPYPLYEGGYLTFSRPLTNQLRQIRWDYKNKKSYYSAPKQDIFGNSVV